MRHDRHLEEPPEHPDDCGCRDCRPEIVAFIPRSIPACGGFRAAVDSCGLRIANGIRVHRNRNAAAVESVRLARDLDAQHYGGCTDAPSGACCGDIAPDGTCAALARDRAEPR